MSRPVRRAVLAATCSMLATAGALAAAAPAQAAAPGSVTGIVRDGTAPFGAGVVVTARTPGNLVLATTTTDASGAYDLTGIPAGDRLICFDGTGVTSAASAAGYLFTCSGGTDVTNAVPVKVVAGEVRKVPGVVRKAAALTGRVVDRNGAPVAGAVVEPSRNDPRITARSAADGSYRVLVDPDDVWYLQPCFRGASATGAGAQAGYLDACPSAPSEQTEPGRVYVRNQKLAPATALTGRVTDYSGRALSGVRVRVSSYSPYLDRYATSAVDGTYRVDQLPGGVKVTIVFVPTQDTHGASTLGYSARCWRDTPALYGFCERGATGVTTRTGAVQSGLDVSLHAAGGISGRIVDVTGRPIPDVEVSVSGVVGDSNDYARTAADGTWSIANVEPATYHRVCAQLDYFSAAWPDPDGYAGNSFDNCWHAPDSSGSFDDVPVTAGKMTTGIDFQLVGNGAISGRAVDASGAPLAGVGVEISSPDERGAFYDTGPDGSFRAGRLAIGSYQVCFETYPYTSPRPDFPALGWTRQCSTVEVTDNVTSTVPTATMVEGGAVTGAVTDGYGFGLDDVTLHLVETTTGASYDTTAYDTGYRIDSLPAGRYSVCFDPTDARRHVDGRVPAHGWAARCWKKKTPDLPPTLVTVVSGVVTGGISVVLPANPAH